MLRIAMFGEGLFSVKSSRSSFMLYFPKKQADSRFLSECKIFLLAR